jgi:tagaturonate reductase
MSESRRVSGLKQILNRNVYQPPYAYPPKAIQVGEGNFIRAFVNWMIDLCNEQGVFEGTVIATQPRRQGAPKIARLKSQDGLFTVISRGLVDGKPTETQRIVSSISRALDPYEQWDDFLALADDPRIRYVFSNTTEAGIVYQQEERDCSRPPHSFPGKLAAFLYRRYRNHLQDQRFSGLLIVPCELLERAGDDLRRIVLQHAEAWGLEQAFQDWVQRENVFLNSIVDRIVTGYPQDEAEQLEQKFGYTDGLITVAEPYYLWILEGDEQLAEQLPFHQAGLNVEWVEDLTPYIQRKVRILNGAHTFLVPIAFRQGHDTVREAVNDEKLLIKLQRFLLQTVLPTIPLEREALTEYVQQTLERFRNPYLQHRLLDIALNSTSKFCSRLLPTLVDHLQQGGQPPDELLESLAHLLLFYRCEPNGAGGWRGWRTKNGKREAYGLNDSEQVLATFHTYWNQFDQERDAERFVRQVLASADIWPTPLSACGLDGQMVQMICRMTAQKLDSQLELESQIRESEGFR